MSLSKKLPVAMVSPLKVNNEPLHKGAADETVFETISLEGLPEGTTVAQVVRCNRLLKHITRCGAAPGTCTEGGACRRTKQILAHHLGCMYRRRGRTAECSICQQLLALCRIHSQQCQDDRGKCTVLYCKNKRVNLAAIQNQTQPAFSTEHQQMLRKLFINLLANKKKLEGIEHLQETNHPATAHSAFGNKKLKSQLASTSHDINNQTISKEMKTQSLHQRAMYTNMLPQPSTCKLKLDILVGHLSLHHN